MTADAARGHLLHAPLQNCHRLDSPEGISDACQLFRAAAMGAAEAVQAQPQQDVCRRAHRPCALLRCQSYEHGCHWVITVGPRVLMVPIAGRASHAQINRDFCVAGGERMEIRFVQSEKDLER